MSITFLKWNITFFVYLKVYKTKSRLHYKIVYKWVQYSKLYKLSDFQYQNNISSPTERSQLLELYGSTLSFLVVSLLSIPISVIFNWTGWQPLGDQLFQKASSGVPSYLSFLLHFSRLLIAILGISQQLACCRTQCNPIT